MKTSSFPKLAAVAAAFGASLLLAACGGSDGDYSEPVAIEDPNLMPSSAVSSTQGLFKFASGLAQSDTTEALKLGSVGELPTSETEEPMAVSQ